MFVFCNQYGELVWWWWNFDMIIHECNMPATFKSFSFSFLDFHDWNSSKSIFHWIGNPFRRTYAEVKCEAFIFRLWCITLRLKKLLMPEIYRLMPQVNVDDMRIWVLRMCKCDVCVGIPWSNESCGKQPMKEKLHSSMRSESELMEVIA